MFTLTKRNARVGTNLNGRTQFEGDEEPKAIDFTLLEIPISGTELAQLCLDPNIVERLYLSNGEPALKIFKSLTLEEKIEEGNVTLYLGGGTKPKNLLKLTGVKIAKIQLTCASGFATTMECQIQCKPKLDGSIGRLLDKLNKAIQIEIEVQGYGEQQDAFESKAERKSAKATDKHATEEQRALKGAKRSRKSTPNKPSETPLTPSTDAASTH